MEKKQKEYLKKRFHGQTYITFDECHGNVKSD